MTPVLQRITTEYIATEDRIRLAGETDEDAPLVVWLTQRLLKRLLPPLLRWLKQGEAGRQHADILRAFAQQAAKAEQLPQPPVRPGADSAAWVAQSVDVATAPHLLELTFRAGEAGIRLPMDATLLRQWLAILYEADRQAEWALPQWPGWVRDGTEPTTSGPATILH